MSAKVRSRLQTTSLALVLLALSAQVRGNDEIPIDQMVKKWEKEIRSRMEKDAKLKALAAKYPLVVLHSRHFYCKGDYKQSTYSFLYETFIEAKHGNDVQLQFHNGGKPNTFEINMVTNQQNLVVDLGKTDFTKDPDPSKIGINHAGMGLRQVSAQEGHVYLQRVRDDNGNDFYVVFQIVTVDEASRYMAFVWRTLPGGKVVRKKVFGVG